MCRPFRAFEALSVGEQRVVNQIDVCCQPAIQTVGQVAVRVMAAGHEALGSRPRWGRSAASVQGGSPHLFAHRSALGVDEFEVVLEMIDGLGHQLAECDAAR